jgi:hypothetical protein
MTIYLFRSRYVGNDSYGYAGFFSGIDVGGYGSIDAPDETMEGGIVYFGKILRIIFLNSDSYIPYFIFSTIFFFTPIVYLINKHSYNKALSLLWFMTIIHSGLLVLYFSMFRQLLAMSFVMYGYILYENRIKYWKGLLPACFLIAILFHNTIVFMEVILLLLYFIRGRKNIFYIAIAMGLLIRLVLSSFSTELFSAFMDYIQIFDRESRILKYEDSYGETSQSVYSIILLAISACIFVYFSNQKEVNSIYLKCYVFATCIYFILDGTFMINRLSSIFWVIGLCGAIPYAIKRNKKLFLLTVFISVTFLLQAFLGYEKWPKMDSTVPYYFMWEK